MALSTWWLHKKKITCPANENACNAGTMKSTCWSHQATILKAHRKIREGARRRKRKVFFPPLSLFYFKSVISSLGIIFWLTPSVSSSKMVGEHYSHGKICLLSSYRKRGLHLPENCTAPEMISTPKWSPTLKWSPNQPQNDTNPEMIPISLHVNPEMITISF